MSTAKSPSFPVVGIGASAGGLEAVCELLNSLSPDTGMAFIFVQHLAPEHTSMLVDILSKKTAMPVSDATDGHPVEPNHVYVIPPNTIITIVQGRLVLRPRSNTPGPHMPIDDLFYSLAKDRGANAIGVSLSGAGTDGALGMQSIKNEGGVTFAQDQSAQYSSMPRAAVKLGCVDFILSAPEIAKELARISQHAGQKASSTAVPGDPECNEADLKQIFQLLQHSCNLDFSHYKRGTIKRRLTRRMALQNFNNIPDYINFLKASPEEVKALGDDFLIHVTKFFRDPDVFEAVLQNILPRLTERLAPESPLRIWVPACSTGEEVYSIAICCLEYLATQGRGRQIQIFGTDVSEPAIKIARAGVYAENIARNVSPERLKKFFVKTNEHYEISRAVRDICIFALHDLTNDPPYSKLDMVSCHNLLIYLDLQLQKRVLPLLHYALNPEGILLLGPAESISGFTDIFTLVDDKGVKFYTKKALPLRAQLKYLEKYVTKISPPPSSSPSPMKRKYTEVELQKREADRITLSRYVPAAILCDKNLNILEFRGDTSPYLIQTSGPPYINLQKFSLPGLLVEITKAVRKAGEDGAAVRNNVRVDTPRGEQEITLEVVPVRHAAEEEPVFLIFFGNSVHATPAAVKAPGFMSAMGDLIIQAFKNDNRVAGRDSDGHQLSRLKQELDDTRSHIRTMLEDHDTTQEGLQASQEDLLSSNEEFQSTNEELETAKEELQSANEELITTNEEVRRRNADLTELNEKLEQALNYSDAVIRTVSQPFLVLDEELHILQANPAFYRAFKTTPEATERRLLYDLGDKQWNIPELRQLLQSLLMQETAFKSYEITHVFPGVGKKTMRLNGTLLVSKKKTQIFLAMEDVSDYRTALESLQNNSRHKDVFLAMLGHELRNPLTPIRNALEIWKLGDTGKRAEKESQMIMDRQLTKLVRLVDDLLDVARITRGLIVLEKNPVNLSRSVEHALDELRPRIKERQHELTLSLPAKAIFVKGDAIRLEQIISNLIINAIKYTDPGGRIAVTLERDADEAVIRIVDNGIGLSPEVLLYIFDLFVQAERAVDRKQGGLGIGLTLVRRLAELQGGTVAAKSEGLGKGSEFIVRLPIISGEEISLLTDHSPTPQKASFVQRRILIIDDNPDAATTTKMLLELLGHKTETAPNGPSGIQIVHTFRPEVILLDIGLPDMDGYEVAKLLRQLPESKGTLLIALSGYGQPEDIRKSKETGFDHYLVKPANIDQLQALISKLK